MATGHIRRREGRNGKVSYQLIVETERDPITGNRERHYKTVTTTKKQAEALLRKMINDVENNAVIDTSSMKLADWMLHWFNTYTPNIAETTRAGYYEKITNYIIPALGNIPLCALKTDHIQQWINSLRKSLSPKTITNAYNILNSALKKAVTLRMIAINPCVGVERPKLVKYQANVYDNHQIKQVLELAKGTNVYLIALLALTVGVRRGELAGLKWKHIDFVSHTITICDNRVHGDGEVIEKTPKSMAGIRTLTVGEEVISALSEAKLAYDTAKTKRGSSFHDEGYVIHKEDGSPYHPDSLTTMWNRFTKKNGLDHIRLHDLRHTNATAMIQAGVSPKVVQHRLGHADVSITLNTYTHVLPCMDQDAADKIDDAIFS